MLYKKVPLDPRDENTFLEVFVPEARKNFTRSAILVIPGGGYNMICHDREGEPVAQAFLPYGYSAFVLHYSVHKGTFPLQLIQASMAMKHIRDHAEEYHIDPDRVFAVGFSAGGHLAATLGTMWNRKDIYEAVDMPFGYNKPTGVMLIYPPISASLHTESFQYLHMTKTPTPEQCAETSVENAVGPHACPVFILHTADDAVVDVRNSLLLADRLSQHKIPYEMHIYPSAPHGICLGNAITSEGVPGWDNPNIARWVEMAASWAKDVAGK